MLHLVPAVALVGAAAFGEIFGDLRLGDKYLADAKVELKCADQIASATTDSSGSFRISVKGNGKCTVAVSHDKQTAELSIVVFDKPARYRLVLESKDGKYTLKRV